jgi:hypothetical protein
MIKGGIGGGRTKSGLKFEERVDLLKLFYSIPNYSILGYGIYFKGKKVADCFKKYSLYKNLLIPNKIDWKDYISKQLLPDNAILVKDTLFIIEIKFQEVAGSVDEKLQTCDFKKKQYNKLLSHLGINVEYIYVLSNWFKKEQYKDTLEYIESVGCHYFFEEIPLNFLDLETDN